MISYCQLNRCDVLKISGTVTWESCILEFLFHHHYQPEKSSLRTHTKKISSNWQIRQFWVDEVWDSIQKQLLTCDVRKFLTRPSGWKWTWVGQRGTNILTCMHKHAHMSRPATKIKNRGAQITTHKEGMWLHSVQDTITPLYIYIANCFLLLY